MGINFYDTFGKETYSSSPQIDQELSIIFLMNILPSSSILLQAYIYFYSNITTYLILWKNQNDFLAFLLVQIKLHRLFLKLMHLNWSKSLLFLQQMLWNSMRMQLKICMSCWIWLIMKFVKCLTCCIECSRILLIVAPQYSYRRSSMKHNPSDQMQYLLFFNHLFCRLGCN